MEPLLKVFPKFTREKHVQQSAVYVSGKGKPTAHVWSDLKAYMCAAQQRANVVTACAGKG